MTTSHPGRGLGEQLGDLSGVCNHRANTAEERAAAALTVARHAAGTEDHQQLLAALGLNQEEA